MAISRGEFTVTVAGQSTVYRDRPAVTRTVAGRMAVSGHNTSTGSSPCGSKAVGGRFSPLKGDHAVDRLAARGRRLAAANPREVLMQANAVGLRLSAERDRLVVEADAPGVLTDEWRDRLPEHKPGLLIFLANPPRLSVEDNESLAEGIEEGAAIREFDGGETQETAEREARCAMHMTATVATQEPEEPVTVASVAIVAVAERPEPLPEMSPEEEFNIRAWLAYIEETDRAIIVEVLGKCGDDLDARRYFLKRSGEVLELIHIRHPVTCGDCIHFERIDHPNLGHCAKGEHEAGA